MYGGGAVRRSKAICESSQGHPGLGGWVSCAFDEFQKRVFAVVGFDSGLGPGVPGVGFLLVSGFHLLLWWLEVGG